MKKLTLSRGDASYETRGLDSIAEREFAIQEDCVGAIRAVVAELDSKAQAEIVAKAMMATSAAIHSDIERILRQHGRKENADV